jgi:hypothetical protein
MKGNHKASINHLWLSDLIQLKKWRYAKINNWHPLMMKSQPILSRSSWFKRRLLTSSLSNPDPPKLAPNLFSTWKNCAHHLTHKWCKVTFLTEWGNPNRRSHPPTPNRPEASRKRGSHNFIIYMSCKIRESNCWRSIRQGSSQLNYPQRRVTMESWWIQSQ